MDIRHRLDALELELDCLHSLLHQSNPELLRDLIELMDSENPEGPVDRLPAEEAKAAQALRLRLLHLRTVLNQLEKT